MQEQVRETVALSTFVAVCATQRYPFSAPSVVCLLTVNCLVQELTCEPLGASASLWNEDFHSLS